MMYLIASLKLLTLLIALYVILYVVRFSLKSRKQFAPGNQINEEIIEHSGRANYLYGDSVRLSDGGYLVLTNEQLWFLPHGINISTQIRSIPRSYIKRVFPRKSFGIIPNGLGIELTNKEFQYFIVKRRNGWLDALHSKDAGKR